MREMKTQTCISFRLFQLFFYVIIQRELVNFIPPEVIVTTGSRSLSDVRVWRLNKQPEIQMQNKIYWWEGEMKTDKSPFKNTRFHTESHYLAKTRWGRSPTTLSWNTWRTPMYFLGPPGVAQGQGWPPVPQLLPLQPQNFQCIHYTRYFQSEVHIWQGFEVRRYTSLPTGFSAPPVSSAPKRADSYAQLVAQTIFPLTRLLSKGSNNRVGLSDEPFPPLLMIKYTLQRWTQLQTPQS